MRTWNVVQDKAGSHKSFDPACEEETCGKLWNSKRLRVNYPFPRPRSQTQQSEASQSKQ